MYLQTDHRESDQPTEIKSAVRAVVASFRNAFAGKAAPPRIRLEICRHLLGLQQSSKANTKILARLTQLLSSQPLDEQHYWVSTLSTLLMMPLKRVELAAYFTPPPIVRHLIAQAEKYGLDLTAAEIIDPAAGGAAFISSLAGRMRDLGCDTTYDADCSASKSTAISHN